MTTSRTIGILAFPDMEELDALGPYEVLAAWAQNHPDDAVEVVLFSPDGAPVRCAKGLTVQAQASADDVGPLDVFVHPGGIGTRVLMAEEAHLDWLRGLGAPITTSVCTGALVLAAAGLLAGRPRPPITAPTTCWPRPTPPSRSAPDRASSTTAT